MELDIREERKTIDSIRVSDDIVISYNNQKIEIHGDCSYIVINKTDINNTIKALEKAKELWCPELNKRG